MLLKLLKLSLAQIGAAVLCACLAATVPFTARAGGTEQAAHPRAPAGWTVSASTAGLLYQAPEYLGAGISLLVAPSQPANADFKAGFSEDVPALIEDMFGEITRQGLPKPVDGAPKSQGAQLAAYLVRSSETDTEIRISVMAYTAADEGQRIFILSPKELSSKNAAYLQAFAFANAIRRSKYALTSERLTEALGSPPESAIAVEVLPPLPDDPEARIEGVIYYLEYDFDAGSDTAGPDLAPVTATLLSNGRLFEREPSAPAGFNPEKRADGSRGVGRWKKDGEGYALTFTDGGSGTAVSSAAKTFPAPAVMTLSGTYLPQGGGTATGNWTDGLTFKDDETVGISLGTDPAGTPLPPQTSRSYRISQRTIDIINDEGSKSSRIFGFQGTREAPELLVIGDQVFTRQD
jgi:hypothetical protein